MARDKGDMIANTPLGLSLPVEHSTSFEPPAREAVFTSVLAELAAAELTWGDLVEWISDPDTSCPAENRYNGFLCSCRQVLQVLDQWTLWRNCLSGRRLVQEWALSYINGQVQKEGDKAMKSNILQSQKMRIDELFVLNFSLLGLYQQLSAMGSTITAILHAFSTTPRQERAMTDKIRIRKQQVRVYA